MAPLMTTSRNGENTVVIYAHMSIGPNGFPRLFAPNGIQLHGKRTHGFHVKPWFRLEGACFSNVGHLLTEQWMTNYLTLQASNAV